MKRYATIFLKVTGIVLAVLLVLMLSALALLQVGAVQNYLVQRAVKVLKEELKTEVSVGKVDISFLNQSLELCDMSVDDHQGRPMLRVDKLGVGMNLRALLDRKIVVTRASLDGVRAQVYVPATDSDSVANFQFLVDAFKHKSKQRDTSRPDSAASPLELQVGQLSVDMDSLYVFTDNHKPRHNAGKPHFGAFDVGHLDAWTSFRLRIDQIDSSGVAGELQNLSVEDRGSGLRVENLQLKALYARDSVFVSDLAVKLAHTQISVPQAALQMPQKATGRRFSFVVPHVEGSTQLRDIAQAFAPPLRTFVVPIRFACKVSGDEGGLKFENAHVTSAQGLLDIRANGFLKNFAPAQDLIVHFDVSRMHTNPQTVLKIINQFTVRKFMLKQLQRLGQLDYRGYFDILYHKEMFAGHMNTREGGFNFSITNDDDQKYLSGSLSTKGLELGRVMDLPDLGKIACSANFRMDTSKPRTARMRRKLGGKLPIGTVSAKVDQVSYKKVTVRNIEGHIDSNGAEAQGRVAQSGKLLDLVCNFTFTDTDNMSHVSVKPGVKFHLFGKKDDKKPDAKDAKQDAKASKKAARKAGKQR